MIPGFPEHLDVGLASGFPEQSSLGIHGIEGTTHLSSFARASEIIMRYSVSSDRPRLHSPLVFVSQIDWAIPKDRAYPIVSPFGLVWVDRTPMCILLEASSS